MPKNMRIIIECDIPTDGKSITDQSALIPNIFTPDFELNLRETSPFNRSTK